MTNLQDNIRAKPGDPDYWERSRLEMFAITIGYWIRDYHQPPKARLPIEDYEWLYGFHLPRLRRALPYLREYDQEFFASFYKKTGQHNFESFYERYEDDEPMSYYELWCDDDDDDEEWTEKKVERIYRRTKPMIDLLLKCSPEFRAWYDDLKKSFEK